MKGQKKENLNAGVKARMRTDLFNQSNPDDKWKLLKNALQESAEESISLETRRAAKKPWVTEKKC